MLKKCLVMAGGELRGSLKIYQKFIKDQIVFAADRGADYLLQMGIWPCEVFGDFDSIKTASLQKLEKNNIPLTKFSTDKDSTDLELLIDYLIAKDYQQITVLGALGGRLDHLLAQLSILERMSLFGVKGLVIDQKESLNILEQGVHHLEGEIGEGVSLIAMHNTCPFLTLTGFKFSLKEQRLYAYETLGISNCLQTKKASIEVREGRVLLIRKFISPFGSQEL